MVIDVITEIQNTGVDKTFSYLVPDQFKDIVKIGARVTIPFGKQILEGFIVGFNNNKDFDYELKEIIGVVDLEPVLNEELLELGNYISKKVICPKTKAYQTMLPIALKAKQGTVISKKYETYLEIVNRDYLGTSKKQEEIINLFSDDNRILKKEASRISQSAVKTLIDKNILKEVKEEVYRINDDENIKDNYHSLNDEQLKAYNAVVNRMNSFSPFLLYGVTGSGKTEVYMHLIEKVLITGKEAIVLVPEISLTPQMVSQFKGRFKTNIAIIHSGLSQGEKYDEWRKIVRKEVSIVIGARSAIFAPLTNLGIIIIDEEHSSTYKQDSSPNYNAIDIALKRAKTYNCPLVLGSATPSVESFTRSKVGIYELLTMKQRVNKTLPVVTLVDMKPEIKKGYSLFSRKLDEAIKKRLELKEQVIILLNRRGFSTVLTCHNCGYTDKCPNCDIPLTYHKASYREKCHYCNYSKPLLKKCPECGSTDISQFGLGTQKLEEEIIKRYKARVIRMDADTTRRKNSHKKMIEDFGNHKYDILVGTQMISKGLDFPNVTLVGVLNGDSSLNVPDFRSAERTFQLLNQVAGRSGRGLKSGEVIIQGFNMDHYSVIKAKENDYLGFYNEEIKIRKLLSYPPFFNICLIKITGKDEKQVHEEINKIASYLRREVKKAIILGPSNANMYKINKIYNVQVMLKYKQLKDIYINLQFIYDKYKTNHKVKLEIDINPNKL